MPPERVIEIAPKGAPGIACDPGTPCDACGGEARAHVLVPSFDPVMGSVFVTLCERCNASAPARDRAAEIVHRRGWARAPRAA